MALLETVGEVLFEKTIFGIPNIVVGVAAIAAAPVVVPALRPVTKAIIKGGIVAADRTKATLGTVAERTRVAFSEAGERWGDLIAEARAEVYGAAAAAPTAAQTLAPEMAEAQSA
ncbi:MAG: DUF5132 domain-containing protein [Roseiflexaceae bacterium]|nr:DUF5132 domain-containing protein [Roseiflexus sp.]MDW8213014.1 DUF5132 domain-containing protein [Roseiflexaceae bacterium]